MCGGRFIPQGASMHVCIVRSIFIRSVRLSFFYKILRPVIRTCKSKLCYDGIRSKGILPRSQTHTHIMCVCGNLQSEIVMDTNTQLLHSINAKLASLDTRMCAIEAKVGESHAFIQPKAEAKPKVVKTKTTKKAKPSSPAREDWKNFKALAKASGWTQEFYQFLEAWKKSHKLPKKLQGEDYFVAYSAAFREKYVA